MYVCVVCIHQKTFPSSWLLALKSTQFIPSFHFISYSPFHFQNDEWNVTRRSLLAFALQALQQETGFPQGLARTLSESNAIHRHLTARYDGLINSFVLATVFIA